MKPKKSYAPLAALLTAALLICTAPSSTAQRRRPPAPPPTPAPASGAPAPAAPRADAHGRADSERQRQEVERPFEELLSADGYAVVAELRKLARLAQLGEVKAALDAVRAFDESAAVFIELADFINENEEVLSDARVVVALMPTRAGLPEAVVALQLPTPEVARSFEPKYRGFLNERERELLAGGGARGRVRVTRTRRSGSAKRRAGGPAAGELFVRRSGSWLLAADRRFTLKQLGGGDAGTLADNARFQTARARFANEAVFVYVDVGLTQQGWMLAAQREQEERERAARENPHPPTEAHPSVLTAEVEPPPPPKPTPDSAATDREPATETAEGRAEGVTPAATPHDDTRVVIRDPNVVINEREAGPVAGVGPGAGAPDAPPSEEQLMARQMQGLLRGIWEGIPRIPGTVAAAIDLEGDTMALRVAVDNPPEGPVNVIPFLTTVIAGPPISAEAAAYAPADSDVFVTASVDWAQIFNAIMGAAASREVLTGLGAGGRLGGEEGGEPASVKEGEKRPPTAEETLALVEKFFGFKFKEDLLPALGGEVAVSLPLQPLFGGFKVNREQQPKEEKDAEPGFAMLVSLNDPDKVRRILPRVLAALGFLAPGAQFASERREGVELHHAPGLSYAVVNNFLALGTDPKAVRHLADAHARNQTLGASNSYRDATAWQQKQKLVQAYVSEGLMKNAIGDTKKQAAGSTDPAVITLLRQLDVTPEPASYAATNEGDVMLHELRLPLNLIKAFSAGVAIGAKEAPVISSEIMAQYALMRIREAEEVFINSEEHDRYGTIEELIAEEVLEKGFPADGAQYEFRLNAIGDKYEATATPKSYGKTGRRSFFVDETGIIRGADHKGKPATASDPPVD